LLGLSEEERVIKIKEYPTLLEELSEKRLLLTYDRRTSPSNMDRMAM
jgi:hypothetical protein